MNELDCGYRSDSSGVSGAFRRTTISVLNLCGVQFNVQVSGPI